MAAAAFAGMGALTGLKQVIDLSAAAEQSLGGVQAVFKNYANGVIKDSKAADRQLGLSANSYRELATVIGSQLKNAGVPMDELAGKTDGLITMGADLAAMFGGTTQDAVNALSSALKGEMDPIERYGITLNDAALKAEAMSLGLYSGKGNLDANAKAMAVMSLVTKQGADSVGAFGRENDTAAGRAQRAAAQWENLKTSIGDKLLPAWSALMDFVGTKVLPGLSKAGDFIGKVKDGFGAFADLVFKGDYTSRFREIFGVEEDSPLVGALLKVHDGLKKVVDFVKDHAQPILAGLGAALAVLVTPLILSAIGSLVSLVGGALAAAFGALLSPIGLVALAVGGIVAIFVQAYKDSEPLREAVQKLKDAFGVFFDAFDAANGAGGIQGFFDGLQAGIKAAWPLVKEALRDMGVALWSWIKENIGPALQQLGEWLGALLSWVWNEGLPQLINGMAALGGALLSWIGPKIGPALIQIGEWLGQLLSWIWNTGLPMLGQALADLGQALIDWIGPRIGPMLVAIGEFLGKLVDWIWNTGLPWLWDTLVGLGQKLIDWIVPRIPGMLGAIAEFLGKLVGWLLFTGLPMLVGGLLKLGWELISWIVPRIPEMLVNIGKFLAGLVGWIITDGLPMLFKALWAMGTGAIKGLWESIQNSPFIQKIGSMFSDLVGAIGRIWDGLVDKLKEPVRIVIRFINDKIIDNVNKVTKHFGLTIPSIPLNFHTGGIVPGYTPGRDTHIAAVGGGEAVMRPEFTRAVGADFIHGANQAARMGGAAGVRDFLSSGGPGFASGGIVGGRPGESGGPLSWISDKVSDGINWAKDSVENLLAKGAGFALKHLVQPAVNWITSHIDNPMVSTIASGAMKDLVAKVEEWGSQKDSESASNNGDVSVPGSMGSPAGRGYAALFAIIKRAFPQANLNSAYRPGDPGYHGKGLAVDLGQVGRSGGNGHPYLAAMNQWIYDNFPSSRELIYDGLGDNRPDLKNGRPLTYNAATRAAHHNHVHWVYDDGGVLEPGVTSVHNKSGKPEAVLTNEEMKNYKRLIAEGSSGALVENLTIQVGQGADVRDGMEAAMFELRRIKRGGGIR